MLFVERNQSVSFKEAKNCNNGVSSTNGGVPFSSINRTKTIEGLHLTSKQKYQDGIFECSLHREHMMISRRGRDFPSKYSKIKFESTKILMKIE